MSARDFSNFWSARFAGLAGFQAEVSKGDLSRLVPGVVVSEESTHGRGQPVFDCYRRSEIAPGIIGETFVSLKVSSQDRNPRTVRLCLGDANGSGPTVLTAVMEKGLSLPVVACNFSDERGWEMISVDFANLVREHGIARSEKGVGVWFNPETVHTVYAKLRSGRKAYRYEYFSFGFSPGSCGLAWEGVTEAEIVQALRDISPQM
jgi:hypothetical protein